MLYALAGLILTAMRSDSPIERTACRVLGLCADARLQQQGYAALRSSDPDAQKKSTGVFLELVRRNPASASAWCDLGGAYLANGDTVSARLCFDRAYYLGGNLPPILLRLATFSFSMQDADDVLSRLRRVLAETSRYDQVIFSLYHRLGETPDEIVRRGLPDGARAASAYLRFLLARENLSDVTAAWTTLTQKNAPDDDVVIAYSAQLWGNRRADEAHRIWMSRFANRAPGYGSTTYVYNGGFEENLTQAVFDWNISAAGYATAAIDQRAVAEGRQSLRITFDGRENPAYAGISQILFLEPGSYRLSASVRTDELSSDQGIRFLISDSESAKRPGVSSLDVKGTTEWTTVTADFIKAPGSRVVELHIGRFPSLKFDNKLGGTVWIDDVQVTRK